jgi:hypothetical protein
MKRRLAAWLVPTLVAPVLSSVLLVTVSELNAGLSFFVVMRWLALSAVAAAAAAGLSLSLILVDWALLLLRRRIPPTGARAWISGLAAPIPAYGLWLLFRPPLLSTPLTHALALAGAIVLAAIAVRLVTSLRPGRRFRFV